MKTCETIEAWYKTWCPYCESSNFHCNGDEQDLSSLDVDAVKCCQCNQMYGIGPGDEDFDDIMNPADGIPRIVGNIAKP